MSWLPEGFAAPPGFSTERYRLRPITIHDAVRDYDAVMSSREHLWGMFGAVWGWPPAGMTLEEDLVDLAWHQKEAQLRRSFNYAVVSPDGSRLLGCVYVDPPEREGVEAECACWVRADEVASGLDEVLFAAAREWIDREWPFARVAWPGRLDPWP